MNRKQAQAATALFRAQYAAQLKEHLPGMFLEQLEKQSLLIEHMWLFGEVIEVRFWGYERSTFFFLGSAIEPDDKCYKVVPKAGSTKIWKAKGIGEAIDKLVEFKMRERDATTAPRRQFRGLEY